MKGHAEAQFDDIARRGGLQAIAAHDGRGGSLPIGQDAVVYASVLDSGQVIEHELDPGRTLVAARARRAQRQR